MTINLYINTAAQHPSTALVVDELNPNPIEFPSLVIDDDPTLNLFLVDGQGGFDETSGLAGYTVEFLVGLLNETAAAQQASWSLITNGWTSSIELNTSEIAALIGNDDEADVYAQVQITDPGGDPRTVMQQRMRLRNRVFPGPPGPTPENDYFTADETLDRFVQNRSAITSLTGGGATALDGIVTVSKGPGWIVAVVLSGVVSFYQLIAGTTAENSPYTIRPDDYNGATNAKVWNRLNQAAGPVIQRGTLDPRVPASGIVGAYDWQPYFRTDTGEKFNWNLPTLTWE